MELDCTIDTDYQGNPRIKLTKDSPTVTLTVYTQDLNLLYSLVDKPLKLTVSLPTNDDII